LWLKIDGNNRPQNGFSKHNYWLSSSRRSIFLNIIAKFFLDKNSGCYFNFSVWHNLDGVSGKSQKKHEIFGAFILDYWHFFASFERYIFWNTGYLSTYNPSLPDVTVSYPSLLTVPLTEIVQSAKETYAFNLFRLEYFGDISFESILLSTTYPDGRIEITFYNENANMGFGFRSSSGSPFVASNIPWIGHPPSRLYSG